MKKLVLVLVFIAGAITSNAQNFSIGPMGGLNISTFETSIDSAGVSASSSLSGNGFHGGLFGRFGIKKIYIQPELIYNINKGTDEQTTFGITAKSTVTKADLDVNVLIGYNIVDLEVTKVRLNGGLKNSILMSGKAETEVSGSFFGAPVNTTSTDSDIFNSYALGYTIGAGVDITKITLDVRYNGAIGDIDNDNNATTNLSYISISLGFKIL